MKVTPKNPHITLALTSGASNLTVHRHASGMFGIVVSDDDNQPGIAAIVLSDEDRRALAEALLEGIEP